MKSESRASSQVFFFDYSKGEKIFRGIETLLNRTGLPGRIPKEGRVAVKVHMGERGNTTYLRPAFVWKIVEMVKRAGGIPFVTDTTCLYAGRRRTAPDYLETAMINGFSEQSLSCPIIIDEEGGEGSVIAPITSADDDAGVKEVAVSPSIAKADMLLVLSHVKGHPLAGFGGAIKNVGMGCVTKRSKSVMHAVNSPILDASRCSGCGECAKVCPEEAISMIESLPHVDPGRCVHCSSCFFRCPEKAWGWPPGSKEKFQILLAHAANAVLNHFPPGRAWFLNFVQDVTPLCDCFTRPSRMLVPSIGVLASRDPVAADKAALDLIQEASRAYNTPESFGGVESIFSSLHGTDCVTQLKASQKLGLGRLDYLLVPI